MTNKLSEEDIIDSSSKNKKTNNSTSKKKKKTTLQKTKEELDDTKLQLQESKDKFLRLYAEFENFKKRTIKEKLDTIKSASRETITKILPILDDFDRAKKISDDEKSDEKFSEGVTMVYNKLYTVLQAQGLQKMDTTGQIFDPELHDAITKVPSQISDMKGKIVDTIESGYKLNDKIIRHAKVVVGE